MNSWTWMSASCRGTAHARDGTRKQDAMAVLTEQDGAVLVAVACDGAGSASHGRAGAMIAAVTLARCARRWLHNETVLPAGDEVVGWVEEARLRILDAANDRGLPARDFATTVVMAVSDGTDTITAHIGDGAIVARCAATDEWTALSWPAHGEYASMTSFLTDDELALRVATTPGEINRLVVFTDGIERLALDLGAHAPHAPFFDSVARPLGDCTDVGRSSPLSTALAALLDSDSVNARTDDDKTLILARRG